MTAKNEQSVLNIYQRLAAVMGEVTYIQKENKQGMSYTIVSHDAVTAKVRPVLLKHGIVYHPVRCDHTHNGNRAECAMTVRFVNIDAPADYFDVPTFGYGVDNQDKGPGKAMSYAVKYALLKALGLETGDDPDAENVPHEPEAAGNFTMHLNAISGARTMDELKAAWNTMNADKSLSQKDYDDLNAGTNQRKAELSKPKTENLADGFVPPDFANMDNSPTP